MAGLPYKYTGTILAFGERANINNALTRYLPATGGAVLTNTNELALVIPHDGKLKNLRWSAAASGLTGPNSRITFYLNGIATPLEATWNGAVLSGGNSTAEVPVLASDRVAVRIQLAAGGTNITRFRVSAELEMDSTSPWLADDPDDPDSGIHYVGGGNIGIGTDTPGEKLSVGGIVESQAGGFRFPDGTIQATASGPGGAINALAAAGGTPPDAVYVDGNGRVGIGIDPATTGRTPQERLTLAPNSNLVIEMPAPTGIKITPTPGGNLASGDYFFMVAATDGNGWTKTSGEFSITLSGANQSCTISWNPVPVKSQLKALRYKLYRATASGGPYDSIGLFLNSFQYDSDAGFTPDTPPTETTAYVTKLSSSGATWVLSDRVGIGTSSPQATLDVSGNFKLGQGATITEFSTDQKLSSKGDSIVPTARAVREYVDNLLAGSITAFAMDLPPEGWLECNAQAVSRTSYSRLFSQIGTRFGEGDASTTFNVPDLRGEFIRGWDGTRGVDPTRVIGSWQTDQFAEHDHQYAEYTGDTYQDTPAVNRFPQIMSLQGDGYVNRNPQSTRGAGGNETRPRNIALLYCIKY